MLVTPQSTFLPTRYCSGVGIPPRAITRSWPLEAIADDSGCIVAVLPGSDGVFPTRPIRLSKSCSLRLARCRRTALEARRDQHPIHNEALRRQPY